MRKLITLFIMGIFLASCQPQKIQVVKEVFKDGTPKSIIDYEVQYGDSIPIHRLDFHINGSKRMEGDFVNGKREGEWLSWHPDGTIWSKGFFKNGKRTGKSRIYHSNGKLYMKGEYLDGKKIGEWMVFDEDGILIGDETF